MFAVSETDLGTGEDRWLAAGSPLTQLPAFAVDPPEYAVVVVPHPDDDVLAVGGLLQRLARGGTQLAMVAVTDGEASHAGSSAVRPQVLAARRRAEAVAAWSALGLDPAVATLGVPDGAVEAGEEVVAQALAACCRPGGWVIAPWLSDGHPDHDAAGRAAAVAARWARNRLVAYPVWMWHWATPRDRRVPWSSAQRLDLGDLEIQAKARAVDCFTTQTSPVAPGHAPVLPETVLARFRRRFEVVLT